MNVINKKYPVRKLIAKIYARGKGIVLIVDKSVATEADEANGANTRAFLRKSVFLKYRHSTTSGKHNSTHNSCRKLGTKVANIGLEAEL